MSDQGGDSSSVSRSQSLPLNRGLSGGSDSPQGGTLASQDLRLQYVLSLVNQVRTGSHEAKSHREKCSQMLGAVQLAYSALEWYQSSESHQHLPRFTALVQKELQIGHTLVQVYGQQGSLQKATTVFSRQTTQQKFDRIVSNLDRIANEIWQAREFELQQTPSSPTSGPLTERDSLDTGISTQIQVAQHQNYVNCKNMASCCIQKGHYRNLISKWLFNLRCTTAMVFIPPTSQLVEQSNQGILWWVQNNNIYQHDIGDESTKEIARPDDFQGVVECMALDLQRGVVWLGTTDGRVAVFNDTRGDVMAPTVRVGKTQAKITAIALCQYDGASSGLVGCENGAIYSYRLDKAPRGSRYQCVLNRGKQLSFLMEEINRISQQLPQHSSPSQSESRSKSITEKQAGGDIQSRRNQEAEIPDSPESDTQSVKQEEFQANGSSVAQRSDSVQRMDRHATQNKGLRAHKGSIHCLLCLEGYAWSCGGYSSDCCMRLWQNVSRNNVEVTFKVIGNWSCGNFGVAKAIDKMPWPPQPTNQQQTSEAQNNYEKTWRVLTGHENGQILMWDIPNNTPFRPILVIGEVYSPTRGLVFLNDLGILAVGHANGMVKLRRLSHKLDKYQTESDQKEQVEQQQYRLITHHPKTAELRVHNNGMLYCAGSSNTLVTSGWFGNVRLFPEVYLRNELEREDIPVLPIQQSGELNDSIKDVSRLLRHMTPTSKRLVISIQQQLSASSDSNPSSPTSDRQRRNKIQYKPPLSTIRSDSELKNSNGSNPMDSVNVESVATGDTSEARVNVQLNEVSENSFTTLPSTQQSFKLTTRELEQYNEFLVDYNDLKFLSELGDGSFGRVHKALLDETVVAVKILQAQFLGERELPGDGRDEPMYNLFKEVSVLYSIRHPNVVNFMGLCRSPPCLITEFCERGSLFDVLQEYRRGGMDKVSNRHLLSWHRRIQMLLHAARGMICLHLHRPPIVHRDLKSPNLLVSKDWTVKVADFNLSRFLDTSTVISKAEPNNPLWQAPEVIKGSKYTKRTDVYAFGIIMWEMMTALPPWGEDVHYFAVMQALINDDARPSLGPEIEILGGWWKGHAEYIELMQQCWQQNAQLRPDFAKIAKKLNRLETLASEWEMEQQNSSTSNRSEIKIIDFRDSQSSSGLPSPYLIQKQISNQNQHDKHVHFASIKNEEKTSGLKQVRQKSGRFALQPRSTLEQEQGDENLFASPFEGQDFAEIEEIDQEEKQENRADVVNSDNIQMSENVSQTGNQVETSRQMSQQDSIATYFGGGNPFVVNQK